ncbi:hypothetical protein [Nonlabens agnitus]|uniref:DUF4595 domain-containing protein n=1 Tax=Nonlabens agnitus TaxID=870484 RepID=A0A2S9WX51_9FLAO|nr:hypothetical protein [Nonlabens agnitus]PRP68043.1 hypothetical protein BST86_13555 [Nonlabens agnitus]
MRKHFFYIVVSFLALSFVACDDDIISDDELVEVIEPVDDLVRLQGITIEDDAATVIQEIEIDYDEDSLIRQITFSGMENALYTMTYAINDRLIAFEKVHNGQTTSNTLNYNNNLITLTTTFPDATVQQKELSIDFQNRINFVRTFDSATNGSRTATDQTQYVYSQNFNVERINDLRPTGNSIESTTELTYLFNNNPFRDMNDVIRFLIFEEFVPYTRYLPATLEERFNSNGPPVDGRFVSYDYTLQEDDFPSSRTVSSTTATGTQTTVETFIYMP